MKSTRRDALAAMLVALALPAPRFRALAAGGPASLCGLDLTGAAIATPTEWEAAYAARWGEPGPAAIEAVIPRGLAYDDTDGVFAWIVHYWIRAFLAMAAPTGDRRYMNACVGAIDFMLDHTDERRVARGEIAEDYLRDPGGFAGTGRGGPFWKRGRSVNVLENGQIVQAILRFVDAVRQDTARWTDYAATADRYFTAAKTTVDLFDSEWRDEGEAGSYYYRDSEGSGVLGPTRLAFNQSATMMTAQLLIHRWEPDAARADKIARLAQYWLDGLATFGPDGTVSWPYIENEPEIPEDIGHASLDLDFLVAAEASGLTALTQEHMEALARTFVMRVYAGGTQVNGNVAGTGVGEEAWSIGEGWLGLARFDPLVARIMLAVFNARYPPASPGGVLWARPMLGWANLLSAGRPC